MPNDGQKWRKEVNQWENDAKGSQRDQMQRNWQIGGKWLKLAKGGFKKNVKKGKTAPPKNPKMTENGNKRPKNGQKWPK